MSNPDTNIDTNSKEEKYSEILIKRFNIIISFFSSEHAGNLAKKVRETALQIQEALDSGDLSPDDVKKISCETLPDPLEQIWTIGYSVDSEDKVEPNLRIKGLPDRDSK